jgi:hypothetical protein
MFDLQHLPELLWPPRRKLAPLADNQSLNLFLRPVRRTLRCPAPILQAFGSPGRKTPDPLVARLARNTELLAQLTNREMTALGQGDKPQSLFH